MPNVSESSPVDRGRSTPVVRLRAWGYLRTSPGNGTECSIRLSAMLNDGREVTVSDERGWTSTATLETLSVVHAVGNIDTALLPDDAETTAETHEYALFAERLREAGVITDVQTLRSVPYDVVLVVRRSDHHDCDGI